MRGRVEVRAEVEGKVRCRRKGRWAYASSRETKSKMIEAASSTFSAHTRTCGGGGGAGEIEGGGKGEGGVGGGDEAEAEGRGGRDLRRVVAHSLESSPLVLLARREVVEARRPAEIASRSRRARDLAPSTFLELPA